ncbi:MAG: hypothetical protein ACLFVP_09065 [Candidatus Bathyarchaeia archaeon]
MSCSPRTQIKAGWLLNGHINFPAGCDGLVETRQQLALILTT